MTTSSVQQSINSNANAVFWAGIVVAIGALGVVIGSAFYALSPVSLALPMPTPSFIDALNGAIVGHTTIVAAGTIGIFSDVILAAGALVLMAFRHPMGLPIERLGWALLTISVLVFVLVDSLSGGVLTQIAAMHGGEVAFAGFKLLFDTLFVLGTITFGLGGAATLVSEMKSASPVIAKPLIWIGILSAAAGFVSGLAFFINISLPQVIGISIAVGSLVFAIYGIQIARSVR
ncbi:MAG: hypothetical protein WCA79_19810 [Anaerolineales bacterium]